MSANPLSNETALRIGLAAREIPDTDAARLLRVLSDIVGLPPPQKKLSSLTIKDLKSACDGEFSDVDSSALKSALTYLKGESGISSDPLPETISYEDGDMPNSIRVACASNKGDKLDGHFGSCKRFLIYQVSESENRLIEIRDIDNSQAVDDKNAFRASIIDDCQLLFVASIGGPAAAKVVRYGVHPIKKPQAGSAIDEIKALQAVISKDAPPWLAKVMGQTPEQRIRFEQEELEQEG
ncbi:MAG: dinitrogenase iron-molybdenum cofactor biosynthesis protein [gamma proteobacterium symbiont of Bathyaustriella thionipta]|nr:dinitrogenase iron-molybdenum cofactor biosynthesis protein [gamma proteobacterium symbiont of Bathyaustriella thionipta]MCU7950633.1 dinitrogenase iron-molybdenum cofactor biosynthesis protein [gamma proteobacterium symbiont of Bathyaustriella thionipta]MCU7953731.1 dinitrogenase iron-molybdenum cofactor biosynthesis protein [gamma proteobacterium symbiont of Bathyaustriella thionipta]MCU7957149.1 dinitrogenase iron-molybdenum cofactor biosynthesis protein [gamma proteobacterium symbiont of 